jgi:hypothetical protein
MHYKHNSKSNVELLKIAIMEKKRTSQSGRATPTRHDRLEEIKDFHVAYKKLTNKLLN